MSTLIARMDAPGPKKLLALDGGGIRGMLSIEVLGRIESELRNALNRDENFVLADYFDYVAGTSTGGIIAACIAMGWSVDMIRCFYETRGQEMFDKACLLRRFRHKYEDENLSALLRRELAESTDGKPVTLGSDQLRTLLMLVMRNATTDSPWPISNNPRAKFNDPARSDCNLRFPLWQLVRASTAAPTYFPPEVITVGDKDFIFVDGGVTTYNNPAFQLFLMATVEPYNLNWVAGEKEMLLVSVGTGANPMANKDLQPDEMNLLYHASSLPSALMYAASNEQDFLCRVFGNCVAGDFLDLEIVDMKGQSGPVKPKLFTYTRYNAELTREGLDSLGLVDIEPDDVMKMDSVAYVKELQRVGRAVAEQKVSIEHFVDFL